MLVGLCILLAAFLIAPVLLVAGDKVNINTANEEELSALPGIGPVIAERIIEYRDKNGPFKNTEEITKIKGVGDKTFQKLKDFIAIE